MTLTTSNRQVNSVNAQASSQELKSDEIAKWQIRQAKELLKAIEIELQIPPNDNYLGMSRVVRFHDRTVFLNPDINASGVEAFEELNKENKVILRSWGKFTEVGIPTRQSKIIIDEKESRDPVSSTLTASDSKIEHALAIKIRDFVNSNEHFKVVEMPESTTSKSFLQKIYTNKSECKRCHENVDERVPIGVIAVQIASKG